MREVTTDKRISALNGWMMLVVNLGLLFGFLGLLIHATKVHWDAGGIGASVGLCFAVFMLVGHFMLQPNQAAVLTLFGAYKGTILDSGFFWANPLLAKKVVSLRTRNFDGQQLKVNDQRGNPIEISAVVVWRVDEAARAVFDVDNFTDFVRVQSESALRGLATRYPYDHAGDDDGDDGTEITLRSDAEEISKDLRQELQARLEKAGVEVEEARLNHLAYAPEIAGAMLRRQQAEAIIAARRKIVHGAVSMVEMAITGLSEREVIHLDEERKAAMVSNLLVVLCGEGQVTPVVNTGSLYS
jgi:regulator of protease activity HflC (stomatin/prohibitin superfamily)